MYATLTNSAGQNIANPDGTLPVSGTVAISSIGDPVTTRGDPVDCAVDEYSVAIDDSHSYEILAANPARLLFVVANLGTGAGDFAYLSFGNTATSSHMILGPGEKFVSSEMFKVTDAINMIAAASTAMSIYAGEWTAR